MSKFNYATIGKAGAVFHNLANMCWQTMETLGVDARVFEWLEREGRSKLITLLTTLAQDYHEYCARTRTVSLAIWRTVPEPAFTTAEAACQMIRATGRSITPNALKFIEHALAYTHAPKGGDAFVKVTLIQLGFQQGASLQPQVGELSTAGFAFPGRVTLRDICHASSGVGLTRCGVLDGIQLAVSYTDQPKGERIYVVSDSVIVLDEVSGYVEHKILVIGHDGDGLWVRTEQANLGTVFGPEHQLVFRLDPKE
jgi:hypothetical protein